MNDNITGAMHPNSYWKVCPHCGKEWQCETYKIETVGCEVTKIEGTCACGFTFAHEYPLDTRTWEYPNG